MLQIGEYIDNSIEAEEFTKEATNMWNLWQQNLMSNTKMAEINSYKHPARITYKTS